MSAEVPGTRCVACGRSYSGSPSEPHRCSCGRPLELEGERGAPAELTNPVAGIWSFEEWFPRGPTVELGAGGTPLIDVPEYDAQFKLESCNPTGSFKDRGAALTISRGAALGVDQLKEDSSGNAGRAIAAYAARAGIDAHIYVPEHADRSTLATIEATGATLITVEGDRSAVARACLDAPGWYASHAWRPEFYLGTATCAWEIVANRGGTPPDAVVIPVGHGTLFLGLYRGFNALLEAKTIDTIPRLYAAQLAGAGSLLQGDGTTVERTIAPGVRIEQPARVTQVRQAIEDTGGEVVPVDPSAVIDGRDELATLGFDMGSTAALGVVALTSLRDADELDASMDVVIPITGRSRDR